MEAHCLGPAAAPSLSRRGAAPASLAMQQVGRSSLKAWGSEGQSHHSIAKTSRSLLRPPVQYSWPSEPMSVAVSGSVLRPLMSQTLPSSWCSSHMCCLPTLLTRRGPVSGGLTHTQAAVPSAGQLPGTAASSQCVLNKTTACSRDALVHSFRRQKCPPPDTRSEIPFSLLTRPLCCYCGGYCLRRRKKRAITSILSVYFIP